MVNEMEKQPIIECDNLVKIYKTKDIEVLALQGLELQIDKGELMAIVGNSGSGKSTFLNMIGGLDRPSAGRLIVDGKNLFKLSEKELVEYKRSTVGFVWQNNARNLLPYMTALQNVQVPMMFDSAAKKEQRALELLEMVGMSHRKYSKLRQLSGGEQQRIAIAIALANNPKILLADEPTGSVDVKTGAYILDMFRDINRNTDLTIVIVTHDPNMARKVDRVVAIRDGKISSERLLKQSYRERLEHMAATMDAETTQDEFSILDRAGRLQIPRELLAQMQLQGNRVRIEYQDGKIIIENPDYTN
jgi:ABC-type lipoprotein export system ATPase subunit